MSKIKNTLLITRLFEALFMVVGRRTLDSFAVQILKTTLEKLETKFDILSLVTIHDDFFSEGGIMASFDSTFDTIEPSNLGEAIDALIRVIYMELTENIGDDVGLYFITELKDHLGDSFVDELRNYGLHFERIQSKQPLRYQMKGSQQFSQSIPKEEPVIPQYTLDTVSTW